MSITEEELAAYADGELAGAEEARVAAAVQADAALGRKVERHRALRERLGAHFAPILEQEPPERLTDALAPEARVVDLAGAHEKRARSGGFPRWGWIAGPALAASLVLALLWPRGGEPPEGYADANLAEALDEQLVASQPEDAETLILLSFRRGDGAYCRVFGSDQRSGIACRDASGWELIMQRPGIPSPQAEFRRAENVRAELFARAQEMAAGPALDSEGERAAREADWQASAPDP